MARVNHAPYPILSPAGAIASVEIAEGWQLYERAASSPPWRSLKLTSTTRHRGSANYWLGWNGQRLARNKEAQRRQEQRPELYAGVVMLLQCSSAAEEPALGFENERSPTH